MNTLEACYFSTIVCVRLFVVAVCVPADEAGATNNSRHVSRAHNDRLWRHEAERHNGTCEMITIM